MNPSHLGAAIVCGVAPGLCAQSVNLSALESSVPAPVVELTAAGFSVGVGGLWVDPTASPSATGVFVGFYRGSYAGVTLVHASAAFKAGPRWSLAYGSTEVGDLFDTTLVNEAPGLASLRARAVWAWLDATLSHRSMTGSFGLGLAGDENVGDLKSSTIARAHFRIRPLGDEWLSVGIRASGAIGGSVEADPSGRQVVDITALANVGKARPSASVAVSRGALWRYSETRGGVAAALGIGISSVLHFGLGAGRYQASFGSTDWEWSRALTVGLCIARFRFSFQYASRRLGLGSGYGVSGSYESACSPGEAPVSA